MTILGRFYDYFMIMLRLFYDYFRMILDDFMMISEWISDFLILISQHTIRQARRCLYRCPNSRTCKVKPHRPERPKHYPAVTHSLGCTSPAAAACLASTRARRAASLASGQCDEGAAAQPCRVLCPRQQPRHGYVAPCPHFACACGRARKRGPPRQRESYQRRRSIAIA